MYGLIRFRYGRGEMAGVMAPRRGRGEPADAVLDTLKAARPSLRSSTASPVSPLRWGRSFRVLLVPRGGVR